MKWKIDTSSMPSYLRVKTSGEASPEDFAAMWDDILSSDYWRPGLPVLMDNQNLDPLKDADAFTTAAADYFAANSDRLGKTCISTISSGPENFKYARQFQYGTRLRGSDVVLQVFNSESDAVRWQDHFAGLA